MFVRTTKKANREVDTKLLTSAKKSHANLWMGSKRGKWQAQVSECMDLG
jgi:hypothetical protein